jgi:hypothetical protein
MMSLSPAIQPIRNPGQKILEKRPVHGTLPVVSKDFTDGKDAPSNLSSPYGLSSCTATPYFRGQSGQFLASFQAPRFSIRSFSIHPTSEQVLNTLLPSSVKDSFNSVH